MEMDILDSLDELGYEGPLNEDAALEKALKLGPKSIEFTKLVSWLSQELQALCHLEGVVNAISAPDESNTFLIETSSFLKELNCPYDNLIEGSVNERLADINSRTLFLNFLCTELRAARILEVAKLDKNDAMHIKLDSSSIASSLAKMISDLKIKVNYTETSDELLLKLYSKVNELISKNPELVQPPILKAELSKAQWATLEEEVLKEMHTDYKTRREMLLTRLDVTIQSFKWGESTKKKEAEMAKVYAPKRAVLTAEPNVGISDVLAAREDITVFEKTSSAALVKNTKSLVNKVVIGKVPDRGGRAHEQRPPVEMPSWQSRTQPPPDQNPRGHDGGYRGGGRQGGQGQGGYGGGQGQGGYGGGQGHGGYGGGQGQGGYGGGQGQGGYGGYGGGHRGGGKRYNKQGSHDSSVRY